MWTKLNIIKNIYNWLAEFFKTQFGLFIFFCSLVGFSVWYADQQRDEGKVEGKSFAETETKSLKNEVKKDSLQIVALNIEIDNLKKQVIDCENSNSTENLNREVLKRIDEAEKMKQQLQQRISTIDNYQKSIDKQIKSR